ncbi:MAG: hypothetical protein M3Q10_01625, partial [Chloroflexota bacterium]|nr:hypothetical protein [Chloroflexota bacterium]
QGVDLRIGTLQVQEVTGRDLPAGTVYTVLVGNDGESVPVGELAVTPKGQGMALAFTAFFDRYDRVRLVPKGEDVSAPASPAASPAAAGTVGTPDQDGAAR